MTKKRRRRNWATSYDFGKPPADPEPMRVETRVAEESASEQKWKLDYPNENFMYSLNDVIANRSAHYPPANSIPEKSIKLTLPLAPRRIALPGHGPSSAHDEPVRRISVHPLPGRTPANNGGDTNKDCILSYEDKESLLSSDNASDVLATQNNSSGNHARSARNVSGTTARSIREIGRTGSSLVPSHGVSDSDSESVLPSSAVISQEQDIFAEQIHSSAQPSASNRRLASRNAGQWARTGSLAANGSLKHILVPDSCPTQNDESPFALPRATHQNDRVASSATAQVLVPETPDSKVPLSNAKRGYKNGIQVVPATRVFSTVQKSSVTRNLLDAMELTDADLKASETVADSLFCDEKMGTDPVARAKTSGSMSDVQMSEGGVESSRAPNGSSWSGGRSVISGTPTSRASSDQPSSFVQGGPQDESENCDQLAVNGSEVKRILEHLDMSPGSIEPGQSLALDRRATSDAWALLRRTSGADSSSAVMRSNRHSVANVSCSDDDDKTASVPSEVCPTTPRKKAPVSRLSMDQITGSSYSSLDSAGMPGGSTVRRIDNYRESQDICNSSSEGPQEGDNITTPKALIASRQGINRDDSGHRGNNTGRSSVRGKENRDAQLPLRSQVTPVPLKLPELLGDEASETQASRSLIGVSNTGKHAPNAHSENVQKKSGLVQFPAMRNNPKDLDVDMIEPKKRNGDLPPTSFDNTHEWENVDGTEIPLLHSRGPSLKRGLFQGTRKDSRVLDDREILVSAFKTAKGSAVPVSKKRLNEVQLENLNLEDNPLKPSDGQVDMLVPENSPAYRKNSLYEHDPFAPARKIVKRRRESIESLMINDAGPNTPFLQSRPPAFASAFTTANGAPVPAPTSRQLDQAQQLLQWDAGKSPTPDATSLFTTAKDVPIRVPARRQVDEAPYFLEKGGRKLPGQSTRTGLKQRRESLDSLRFNTPVPGGKQPLSLFSTAKGTPVPVTAQQLDRAGHILPLEPSEPALGEKREGFDSPGFSTPFPQRKQPGLASMFSTAKDAQLRFSGKSTRQLDPETHPLPMHTGGPAVKKPQEAMDSRFNTPFPQRKQPGLASLFTTGKGIPIPVSVDQAKQAEQRLNGDDMKTPMISELHGAASKANTTAAGTSAEIPLFSTGHGRKLNVPNVRQPLARILPFNLVTTPREPAMPKIAGSAKQGSTEILDSAQRVSFPALSGSITKPTGARLTGKSSNRHLMFRTPPAKANGFPTATNARVRASAMKGTPFKRPRRVAPRSSRTTAKPEEKLLQQTKSLSLIFPKGIVPRLSSSGRLIPLVVELNINTKDMCSSENVKRAGLSCAPAVSVVGPAQGLSVLLGKERFGDWHAFPSPLKNFVKIESLSVFGVENCLTLLSHVFPAAENKAATRVGSRAWTKMSYALAVWKLSRLENDPNCDEKSNRLFLTAANIMRELWRRVDREWHRNQAPHLTQMLRRDASPRSHAVLMVSNICEQGPNSLMLEVSDGWYICRLKPCDILRSRINSGLLKIGDKIHVSGCDLLSVPNSEPFFFGDGDELGTSVLAPNANCVKRVRRELTSKSVLGIRKTPLFARTMRGLHPMGGLCPGAQVAIIRSYPAFFIESTATESEKHSIFRRQEAEEAAQAAFENDLRESRMVSRPGSAEEIQPRSVSPAIDIVVTGVVDSPLDSTCMRTVRIYRPNEEVISLVAKEGSVVQLPALKPNGKLWVALSSAVRPVFVSHGSRIPFKPRCALSCADLISSAVPNGTDFDGVYTVLHLAEIGVNSKQRFAFLLDDLEKLMPIALELTGADAETVPRAISRAKKQDQYPIVVLRDATKTGIDDERGIIHATATLRTEIISVAALKRRKGSSWAYLHERVQALEQLHAGDKATTKLEVNREAVMSFISGRHRSIRAYFCSTQDSQSQDK